MDHHVRSETVHFTSTDTSTHMRGVIWWPTNPDAARGVVQIVHGMAEHIMRYDDFARYLAQNDFVVCGHDHVGHGESVNDRTQWGHLPTHGGRDILVGDVGKMRDLVRMRVDSSLPHFLFGHSMGSFVVRAYITECGEGLAGAVICGTGHIAPVTSAAGNMLARLISRTKGERHVSKLLGNLSVGAYAKAIEKPRTPLDWLSFNTKNVDDYIADESCGFPFTTGGNATLTALTKKVCSQKSCERIPRKLPLLYIAGDSDPVGDMGKGVRTAARMAQEAGCTDVTCTIYEHMRHEILNEDDHQRVYDDVRAWIEERI